MEIPNNSNIFLDWGKWGLYNHNKNYNFKVFIAKEIKNVKKNLFYFDPGTHIIKPYLNLVSRLNMTDSVSEADYVFVPHPWISIKKNREYTDYLTKLSKKTPILISNTDDISPACNIPNSLEFRTFLHPRESKYRKIIVPYPSKTKQFKVRSWKPIPTISFIGYVPKLSFGSLTCKSTSFLHSPIKSSVYLNRKISTRKLNNLSKDLKVVCIERRMFTPLNTNKDFVAHSSEYEKNLLESDYVLCPRGFANTSIRFYETLSAGATPVLINSGTNLPELVDSMFWENNIISVNLFGNWLRQIKKDWEYLSKSNNYLSRQLYNRQVFCNELDLFKFSEKIFSLYLAT
jgi:hypothetical protein